MIDIKELRRLASDFIVGIMLSDEDDLIKRMHAYRDASKPAVMIELLDHIEQQEAEIARLRKDAERLDKLDSIGIAYGFEDMHEGNSWMIDGAYSSVRDALDGFSMPDTLTQEVG